MDNICYIFQKHQSLCWITIKHYKRNAFLSYDIRNIAWAEMTFVLHAWRILIRWIDFFFGPKNVVELQMHIEFNKCSVISCYKMNKVLEGACTFQQWHPSWWISRLSKWHRMQYGSCHHGAQTYILYSKTTNPFFPLSKPNKLKNSYIGTYMSIICPQISKQFCGNPIIHAFHTSLWVMDKHSLCVI